jgi:hypothetical protein
MIQLRVQGETSLYSRSLEPLLPAPVIIDASSMEVGRTTRGLQKTRQGLPRPASEMGKEGHRRVADPFNPPEHSRKVLRATY